MRQLVEHENIALLVCRQQATTGFHHVWCTDTLVESHAVSIKTREGAFVFPLYRYTTDHPHHRQSTLSPTLVKEIAQATGSRFVDDGAGDGESTVGPEDVFHYSYAVLHSPTYRTRYAELLKIGFPRIPLPLPTDAASFWALVGYGAALVDLHLLRLPGTGGIGGAGGAHVLLTTDVAYPIAGANRVDCIHFMSNTSTTENTGNAKGTVTINNQQYFAGVPADAWHMQVGSYRPAYKWLYDRKGDTLTEAEVVQYIRIITALGETQRLMGKIDHFLPPILSPM
jgi:predicted helicase